MVFPGETRVLATVRLVICRNQDAATDNFHRAP